MAQINMNVSINDLNSVGYSMSLAGEFSPEDVERLKVLFQEFTAKLATTPISE